MDPSYRIVLKMKSPHLQAEATVEEYILELLEESKQHALEGEELTLESVEEVESGDPA